MGVCHYLLYTEDTRMGDSYPGKLEQQEIDLVVREVTKNKLKNELAVKLQVSEEFSEYEDQESTYRVPNKERVRHLLFLWGQTHGEKATINTMMKALEETSPVTRRMREILKKQRDSNGYQFNIDLPAIPAGSTVVIIQGDNNKVGDMNVSGNTFGDHNK